MSEDGRRRYLDRELSWLDFNGRVLALAEDRKLPLLERVKFLAIFSRNLDEFFMIRVAGLLDRAAAGLGAAATGGLDPHEELTSVRKRTEELVLRQTEEEAIGPPRVAAHECRCGRESNSRLHPPSSPTRRWSGPAPEGRNQRRRWSRCAHGIRATRAGF